jgi:hypothetical protein
MAPVIPQGNHDKGNSHRSKATGSPPPWAPHAEATNMPPSVFTAYHQPKTETSCRFNNLDVKTS